MVISFVLLIVVVMNKIRFHNKIMAFLGEISLEAILINNVFLHLFSDVFTKYGIGLYVLSTIICTIIAAIILVKIKKIILEKR